jgi:hypothetical protein
MADSGGLTIIPDVYRFDTVDLNTGTQTINGDSRVLGRLRAYHTAIQDGDGLDGSHNVNAQGCREADN